MAIYPTFTVRTHLELRMIKKANLAGAEVSLSSVLTRFYKE